MHETHRVYGDKLIDDKDIESFTKMQIDIVKKTFEVKYKTLNLRLRSTEKMY